MDEPRLDELFYRCFPETLNDTWKNVDGWKTVIETQKMDDLRRCAFELRTFAVIYNINKTDTPQMNDAILQIQLALEETMQKRPLEERFPELKGIIQTTQEIVEMNKKTAAMIDKLTGSVTTHEGWQKNRDR